MINHSVTSYKNVAKNSKALESLKHKTWDISSFAIDLDLIQNMILYWNEKLISEIRVHLRKNGFITKK